MASQKDLIHEISISTGTGNFTTSAVNGKVRFSDAAPDGFSTGGTTNVFDYYISNRDVAEWEHGTGHMSAVGTLVRDTVIRGSNGTSLVSFSAGTKDVTSDIPASEQLRGSNIAAGTGITVTFSTPTVTVALSASKLTNSLVAPVSLNNVSNFFDGPSVAQGTSGVWFASGTVTLTDSGAAATFIAKLWDGTTTVDLTGTTLALAGNIVSLTLSGFFTNPAGNIRISVKDLSATTGAIQDTANTLPLASTLNVFRIG